MTEISSIEKELEEELLKLLQLEIEFIIEKKVYREGRIVLFRHNVFCIEFYIQDKKEDKIKKVNIPIPFDYYRQKDKLIFSYKISSLTKDKDLIKKLKSINPECKNRYYDRCMEIKTI